MSSKRTRRKHKYASGRTVAALAEPSASVVALRERVLMQLTSKTSLSISGNDTFISATSVANATVLSGQTVRRWIGTPRSVQAAYLYGARDVSARLPPNWISFCTRPPARLRKSP